MVKLGDPCKIDLEKILITSIKEEDQFAGKVAEFLKMSRYTDDILNPVTFSGGEFAPTFQRPDEVEGKNVYIVSTADPFDLSAQERTKRIEMVISSAVDHGAENVIVIVVDHPYTRQDRVFEGQPRSLRDQIKSFKEKGANNVLTVHVHSNRTYNLYGEVYFEKDIENLTEVLLSEFPEVKEVVKKNQRNRSLLDILDFARPGKVKIEEDSAGNKIKKYEKKEYFDMENEELMKKVAKFYERYDAITLGFGRKVFHSLNPAPLFSHFLLTESIVCANIQNDGENIVLVYPDSGAREFGESIRHHLFLPNISYIQIKKFRTAPNDPDKVRAEIDHLSDNYKNIQDKWIIIADDGTETAGTLVKAVKAFRSEEFTKEYGVPAGIILYFTHPWLNGLDCKPPQRKLINIGPTEIITTNTNTQIEKGRMYRFKKRNAILRLGNFIAAAIQYGFEQGINPEEIFKFNDRKELERVKNLYVVKTNKEFYYRENGNNVS